MEVQLAEATDVPISRKRLLGYAGKTIGAVTFVVLTALSITVAWVHTIGAARRGAVLYPYQFGDFLVNYSAGFVRRGALGELLRYLSRGRSVLTSVSIYIFATFVLFVLSLVFLVLTRAKRRVETLLLFALMPGGFLFMSLTGDFMFRKEFGFVASLSLFACGYVVLGKLSMRRLRVVFSRAAILCAFAVGLLAVLSHESFAFVVGPAFAYLLAGLARYAEFRRPSLIPFVYLLSLFLVFVTLTLFFHGTRAQVLEIWQHTNAADRAQFESAEFHFGSLGVLGSPHTYERQLLMGVALSGYTWWYLGPIALVMLYCFATISLNENEIEEPLSTSWMRCFFAMILAAVPLFLIACDWGRWIFAIETSFLIVWLAMGSQTLAEFDLLRSFRYEHVLRRSEAAFRRAVHKSPVVVFWTLVLFTVTFRVPEVFISLRLQELEPHGFFGAALHDGMRLVHDQIMLNKQAGHEGRSDLVK